MKNSWIRPYLKENKGLILLVLMLGFLTVFSSAALLFTSGFLISKSATQPENILLVYVPIVAVRTFGISRAAFKYVERLMGHQVVLKILSKMRVRVYTSVEPQVLNPSFHMRTGDLLGMLADDIEKLQDIYLKTVFPTLAALALYVVAIVALGFYSVGFAVVMLITAGVLVFLFPYVSLLVTKARVKQQKMSRHALYEDLTDAVMGMSEWQFSGRGDEFIARYEKQEQRVTELDGSRARFSRWRNSLAQVIVLVLVISMLMWTAAQTADGQMLPIMIAAFVLVIFPITEVFLPLSDAWSELPSYEDSLGRLDSLSDGETPAATTAGKMEPITSVTLELKNVSFKYEDKEIVSQVKLAILPGEKVALLGRSGSGKSTIASLVRGDLTPTEGEVTLNEVEVASFGDEVSTVVAVLNQQPYVFDTSIMNNIRLGRQDASDEEVIEAAKKVRLHDYISSLPQGYQTPLHETGMRFSGGERQRVALARMLLQNAPFVILDEPTVGLDPITEAALLETIFEVFQEKSILWITHHLSFVDRADRVLFLENGKIAVEGTHEMLLQTSERYQRLYRLK